MNVEQAKKSGALAYQAGKQMAPALNQGFLRLVCDKGFNLPQLFSAYSHGWTIASLADGVSGDFPSAIALQKIMAA